MPARVVVRPLTKDITTVAFARSGRMNEVPCADSSRASVLWYDAASGPIIEPALTTRVAALAQHLRGDARQFS
jgi:hypothetical protein